MLNRLLMYRHHSCMFNVCLYSNIWRKLQISIRKM